MGCSRAGLVRFRENPIPKPIKNIWIGFSHFFDKAQTEPNRETTGWFGLDWSDTLKTNVQKYFLKISILHQLIYHNNIKSLFFFISPYRLWMSQQVETGRILEIRCPNQLTPGFIGLIWFLPKLKKCSTQKLWFGLDSGLDVG